MVAVVLFISYGRHILLQNWPITGGKPLVEGGETKDLLVTGLVFFLYFDFPCPFFSQLLPLHYVVARYLLFSPLHFAHLGSLSNCSGNRVTCN